MSTLAVTTRDLVKTILEGSTKDDLIDAAILKVSRGFEQYLARDFEKAARTEDHDLDWATKAVFLKHTPVDTGETFEVRVDGSRAFTGSAIDATGYHLKAQTGRLTLDGVARDVTGPGVLRVAYTGGLAVDSDTLQSAYPDIEYAGRLQVAYEIKRSQDPGSRSTSFGGGNRSWTGQLEMLKSVRATLDGYRRRL